MPQGLQHPPDSGDNRPSVKTPAMPALNGSSGHHDAIVIGAGLSGLTAAAFLAQAGARVLVCEQAGQVGGLFNSFRRGGYQFDGGVAAEHVLWHAQVR
jgi:monoamine oxidase